MNQEELIEKIKELKKQKNAVILAHNYQRPEIYKVADFIGDSYGLSKKAMETDASIIVFCGVDFMAETAKILNQEKKVLMPVKTACCPMAAMVNAENLRLLKHEHPDAAVVSYVNTTADVKAESDVCCTSRNAIEIVNSLAEKKVIFVPDQHLAAYVATKTDKEIIPWQGHCYVHQNIDPEMVKKAKEEHPDAEVIVHPECVAEVIKLADCVTSTSGMVYHAKNSSAKKFIVATESGMCERLKQECPDKEFYPVGGICFNMKSITLQSVYDALEKEQHEVNVAEDIMGKAKKAIDKMMEIK